MERKKGSGRKESEWKEGRKIKGMKGRERRKEATAFTKRKLMFVGVVLQ